MSLGAGNSPIQEASILGVSQGDKFLARHTKLSDLLGIFNLSRAQCDLRSEKGENHMSSAGVATLGPNLVLARLLRTLTIPDSVFPTVQSVLLRGRTGRTIPWTDNTVKLVAALMHAKKQY